MSISKTLKRLLIVGGLASASLLLSGCVVREWVTPGNIGVVVKWSEIDEAGKPKIQVTEGGQYQWSNIYYDSVAQLPNTTQTTVFKSEDYRKPVAGFEEGIECKDSGDNGITLNVTARWQTYRESVGVLVTEFTGLPLRSATQGDTNDVESKLVRRDLEAAAGIVCYRFDGIKMRSQLPELTAAVQQSATEMLKRNGVEITGLQISAVHLDDKLDGIVRQDSDQKIQQQQADFERKLKIQQLETDELVSKRQAAIDAAYVEIVLKAFGGDADAAAFYIASRQKNIVMLGGKQ